MSSVREELESFHRFATDRLAESTAEPSFDELLIEWQDRQERESINQAIRRGLADIEAGNYRPAEEVMESVREKFGFSK